jgi:hypothetical protein
MSSQGLKPDIILTDRNYLEWSRQWMLHFGGYGVAGKEIQQNTYIRNQIRRPIIGANMQELQRVDGADIWVDRPMTNEDRKQLPARQAEYDTAQEKYERSRGQLIVSIMSSVESTLLTYIENQPTFDEIIATNDQIKLWNLIKTVNNTKGGSQIELLQKWRNLKQNTENISNHLKQFEQLYANIDTAAAGITPRAKAEQLIRSVNFHRYNPILANHYLQLEQPVAVGEVDNFPTYNALKDKLLRYDEILIKNQSSDMESKTEETIFFTKEKKMHIICYNCGEKGHIAKHCSSTRNVKQDNKFKTESSFTKKMIPKSSNSSISANQIKSFKKKTNLKSKFINNNKNNNNNNNNKSNKVYRMVQVEDDNEEDMESDLEEAEENDSDIQES